MNDKPRVLVTHTPHQASGLADRLRVLGAEPVLVPTIEIVDPASFAVLDAAIASLNEFHWLLFTSANAAEPFARRLEMYLHALPSSALAANAATQPERQRAGEALRTAAIGPATAHALQTHGLIASLESVLIPPQAVAESFADTLLAYARQPDGSPTRFLLVRAEEGRELLLEVLRAAGAEIMVAPAYRTMIPPDSIKAIRELFAEPQRAPQAVTFTSSSSARNLLALCEAAGVAVPAQTLRISIGPVTTQTLEELGLPPHAQATQATVEALGNAVVEALASTKQSGA